MEEIQLQQLVEDVSTTYFQKEFRHKAHFNRRLRTTGGRYLLQSHHIELNEAYYQHFGKEALIEIIKHELCHYHLHLEGKGYRHRDKDFQVLLKQVNAPMYCKRIEGSIQRKSAAIREYQCVNCQLVYVRKRKVDINKYVCGRCKEKLREIRKER